MLFTALVGKHWKQHKDDMQRQPFEVRRGQVDFQQPNGRRDMGVQGGGLERRVAPLGGKGHGFHGGHPQVRLMPPI